ncbi:MAG: DUF1223 domain-containing protein [Flavisolibacter sp.]
MKYKFGISIFIAGLIIVIVCFVAFSKPAKNSSNGYAVIELFTSEGCSSCPPADEAVGSLIKENQANVAVLAFHVDYWDNLGWKDPFSSSNYTERQRQYGNTFHLSSIYTPQAVVNGSEEFVGSSRHELHETINRELASTTNRAIRLTAFENGKNKIEVQFSTAISKSEELNIALVQLHAVNAIKKGENHGKTLDHYNIVRLFQVIALSKTGNGSLNFTLPEGLFAKDCKVIAFSQEINSRKITGVKETEISQKSSTF